MLQILAYMLWPRKYLGVTLVPFFAFLLGISYCFAAFFFRPASDWWEGSGSGLGLGLGF